MEPNRVRVVECRPRSNYRLWLRFEDGLSGEVDLSYLVGQGVFAVWTSVEFFDSVRVVDGTVIWGDELDLDPYVLRERVVASNAKLRGV